MTKIIIKKHLLPENPDGPYYEMTKKYKGDFWWSIANKENGTYLFLSDEEFRQLKEEGKV